jgi:hypothetical protein
MTHPDVFLEAAILKLKDIETKFSSNGPEYTLTPTVLMTVQTIPAQISILKAALQGDVQAEGFDRAVALAKAILGNK